MTILSVFSVSAQSFSDPASFISEKFNSYCKSVPWEEIFVHTDREEYIAGENIWFKAYLTDRSDLCISSHSMIIYMELLGPAMNPVKQIKILAGNGAGNGNIKLSDTLASGTYTMRAYTSWMRNFMPGNCFSKEINIYNSRLTGPFLKGVRNGENYSAREKEEKSEEKFDVNTVPGEAGDLTVQVNFSGNADYTENELFCLFVRSGGTILHSSNEKLSGGKIVTVIPSGELKTGLICITLFDFRLKPVGEKYIYIRDERKYSVIDRQERRYGKREKVTFTFSEDIIPALSAEASLSVSVTPVTPQERKTDITRYLFLGTEFGKEPVRLLKGRSPEDIPDDEMEELLQSLQSRWIIWDRVLGENDQRYRYPLESNEHFLYGTLMETDNWPALQDNVVIMSSPGETALFQYALTDTSGNFSLSVPVDQYARDLVIQPDDLFRFKGIKLRSQFSDIRPFKEIIADSSGPSVPSHILKWSTNYRINSAYEISSSEMGVAVGENPENYKRFYGRPGFELRPDEYMELPNMEEVFFELVPRVRLRRWDSVCDISILDQAGNRLFSESPTLMIDGVIIRDPSKVGNMDPALVKKIDVIWDLYMVDGYQFSGIVNLITKRADFSAVPLSDNAIRINYRIPGPAFKFITPEYSTSDAIRSRIPDLRNTLHWDPEPGAGTREEKTIEFWTSDYTGDFEIFIQGISSTGKPISYIKMIRVE